MTTSLDGAVTRAASRPAPVLLIDTCCFIDLFRRDGMQSRAPVQEIQAAADLLRLVTDDPDCAHLFVPELIPREYADNADGDQAKFRKWTEAHDDNQRWLFEASACVGRAVPPPLAVHPLDLAATFRKLADDLLGKALVLQRDQACLERAMSRLIGKIRPSHRNHLKDSLNAEQCLELSRRLQRAGFTRPRVWVSSNTSDFAETAASSRLHPDLQADFASAGLHYFTSLRAAIHRLRASADI